MLHKQPNRQPDQLVEQAPADPDPRPLPDLVRLIQKHLQLADEAAKQAAQPYWYEAGKLLNEAKNHPTMTHGEFGPWCKLHFKISATQRARYMKAAQAAGADQNFRAGKSSLEDHLRGTSYATGGKARAGGFASAELHHHQGRDPRKDGRLRLEGWSRIAAS